MGYEVLNRKIARTQNFISNHAQMLESETLTQPKGCY